MLHFQKALILVTLRFFKIYILKFKLLGTIISIFGVEKNVRNERKRLSTMYIENPKGGLGIQQHTAGFGHKTPFCYIGNFWKEYFIFQKPESSVMEMYIFCYVENVDEKVPGKVGECIFDT